MSKKLHLYVIGDAGTDLFTCGDETMPGVSASSHPAANATYDVNVPSGASFIFEALSSLFDALHDHSSEHGNSVGKIDVTPLIDTQSSQGSEESPSPVEITPLRQKLTFVAGFGKDEKERFRIDREISLEKSESPPPNTSVRFGKHKQRNDPEEQRLLVVHDAGSGWSDGAVANNAVETRDEFFRQQEALIEHFAPRDERSEGAPRIIVNISGDRLPKVNLTPNQRLAPYLSFQERFWNGLYKSRQHVAIVISIATLRYAGAAVSRRLSWEQIVEDITAELHLFPQLRALGNFRHLFIRVGMVGVVHLQNDNNRTSGRVYFSPYAEDGIHRDPETDGSAIGKNTLLIGSLGFRLQSFLNCGDPSQLTPAMEQAIACAIQGSAKIDDEGYRKSHFLDKTGSSVESRGTRLIKESFSHAVKHLCASPANNVKTDPVVWREIPAYLLAEPLPGELRCPKRWHILMDVLEQAPIHRINTAMAIVMTGHSSVLNRQWARPGSHPDGYSPSEFETWKLLTRVEYWNPQDRAPDYVTLQDKDRPAMPDRSGGNFPDIIGKDNFALNVPIMKFGKLTVAERDEIEGLRSISNLLKLYIRQKQNNDKPVSIAVFGPPGSGKSFAVKELAKTIDPQNTLIKTIEYNVAQFRSPEDLGEALTTVSSASHHGTTPLVFFDEFDCALNGRELGWLKYFLAPMQDGTFYGAHQQIDIGRAIFVFAGGIHSSFHKFDPRTVLSAQDGYELSDEHKERIKHFGEQKGPDFISRLRGHINILEVNAEAGRVKHFIRRSIQLRSLLERLGYTRPNKAKDGRATVDESIIYAMLTVDRYRHGVRSMQAIVQMCTPINGNIQIASLPSRAQLNMHVDAEEFFIRIYRGRGRITNSVAADAGIPAPVPEGAESSSKAIDLVELREAAESIVKGIDPVNTRRNEIASVLGKMTALNLPEEASNFVTELSVSHRAEGEDLRVLSDRVQVLQEMVSEG